MPVRAARPDEEVFQSVREARPDEEVFSHPDAVREAEEGEGVFNDLSPVEEFGRGANIGIAKMLGAPGDFGNFLMEQVGLGSDRPVIGSKNIQDMFAGLGIAPEVDDPDPPSIAGSAGQLVGETATTLLTLGLGPLAKATTAVTTGKQATSTAGRIVTDIGKRATAVPGRFIAEETAAAAAAGAGGFLAQQAYPDSEAAKLIGELGGGLSVGVATAGAKFLPTVMGLRMARKLFHPFTGSGGRQRAEDRVSGSARKQGDAVTELQSGQTLDEAALTPAQQTGDEGLLSLERAVIETEDRLIGTADDQISQATDAIRNSIANMGDGVPVETSIESMSQARAYVMSLLDNRMRGAALVADERIAQLAPTSDPRQANLIAREELEGALDDWHAQEGELWAKVDVDAEVSIRGTGDEPGLKDTFEDMVLNTKLAQQEDIPDVARRLLGGEDGGIDDITTVGEIQALRSKLLEEARKARAAEDFNKARLAGKLADSAMDSLSRSPSGPEWEAAVAISREGKERFSKGSVGRLLGTDKRRGATTSPALTLENTVGKPGASGRVETEALFDAVDGLEQAPRLQSSIEDFLLGHFNREAVRDGVLDPKAAQRFVNNNQDILEMEQFSDLRESLVQAIDTNDAAMVATQRAEGVAKRLNDPKVSKAAVFLKEPVDDAMKRVAKHPTPDKVMKELVKEAARDESGDALKGLKSGFGDHLLNLASTGQTTTGGEFIVSGARAKRYLSKGPGKKMADALLSPDERKRLDTIIETAVKIEKATKAVAKKDGVISDRPALIQNMMAGILGARAGRSLNTGTIQVPAFVAAFFRRVRDKLVTDPAPRLIIDAMQDKDLFEALLKDTSKVSSRRIVRHRLNAWLAGVLAEEGGGLDEPEEEAPPEVTEPEVTEPDVIDSLVTEGLQLLDEAAP